MKPWQNIAIGVGAFLSGLGWFLAGIAAILWLLFGR